MIFAEKQQFNQAFFIGNEPSIVDHLQDFFHGGPSHLLNFLILQMQ